MKVFVVVPDYDYEGYGQPEGVYSSKEAAEAEVARLSKFYGAPRDIVELELDDRSDTGNQQKG